MNKEKELKAKKPPPINVTGFKTYDYLREKLFNDIHLQALQEKDITITAMNNGIFRINTEHIDIYRLIIDEFTKSIVLIIILMKINAISQSEL